MWDWIKLGITLLGVGYAVFLAARFRSTWDESPRSAKIGFAVLFAGVPLLFVSLFAHSVKLGMWLRTGVFLLQFLGVLLCYPWLKQIEAEKRDPDQNRGNS
jgi:membrane protein implicated in regulation of membrane protease activity